MMFPTIEASRKKIDRNYADTRGKIERLFELTPTKDDMGGMLPSRSIGVRVAGGGVHSALSGQCRLSRRMNMNNKTALVLMFVGICSLSGLQVAAQTATGQKTSVSSKSGQVASDQDIQLLRKDIRSQKKQLIAANLSLTATEATKFWPVYDQYQAEYTKIGDAKLALVNEYTQNWGTVTDEQALDYLKRSEKISESVIQLRKKYLPLVNQVLPGKKTALFFQLERRIEMLVDVQVASRIPLVQSQAQ
jgi:hypothetical protein